MEKIDHGIKYVYDDTLNGKIEIPGKFIQINCDDNNYKLLHAKDIEWNYFLDKIKDIDILKIDEYINYTSGEDVCERYKGDNYNKNKIKPKWFPDNVNDRGFVENTSELIDIINYLIHRNIINEEEIHKLSRQFELTNIILTFDENYSNNGVEPFPLEFIISPDKQSSDLTHTGNISTSPSITDPEVKLESVIVWDSLLPSSDRTNIENLSIPCIEFNSTLINSVSSSSPQNTIAWIGKILYRGFTPELNEHTSIINVFTNNTLQTNGAEPKQIKITVKKTPNYIRYIKINGVKFIYFGAGEIYKQVYGTTDDLVSSNILYYPCLIPEDILLLCLGLDEPTVIYSKETDRYSFKKQSASSNTYGQIGWLIENNYIYAYPFNKTNSIDNNTLSKFNKILLKNNTSNIVEVEMDYNPTNCNYMGDQYDREPIAMTVTVINNEMQNTNITFLSDLDNSVYKEESGEGIYGKKYTFRYNGDNKQRFVFNINTNRQLEEGNVYRIKIETTGTKYVQKNTYDVINKTLDYVEGNPIVIEFNVASKENLYLIPYSMLSNFEYSDIYDNGHETSAKDYPIVNNIYSGTSNNPLFDNEIQVIHKINDINIIPFNVIIPIISDANFDNRFNYSGAIDNLSKEYNSKSKIKLWEINPTTNNILSKLFNITYKSNIKYEGNSKYTMTNVNNNANNKIVINDETYELTWKYYNAYKDTYKYDKDKINNKNVMICDEIIEDMFTDLSDSLKTAKDDKTKGKLLFDYFIENETPLNQTGNAYKWHNLNLKRITSFAKTNYYVSEILDNYNFFIPIVFKVNGGAADKYDTTYFCMHLTIKRAKSRLMSVYQSPTSLPVIGGVSVTNNNSYDIKYKDIYKNDVDGVFGTGTEYLKILSNKSKEDYNNSPIIQFGINELNTNLTSGWPLYKNGDDILLISDNDDETKKIIYKLNLNNNNQTLSCKYIKRYLGNIGGFTEDDRWLNTIIEKYESLELKYFISADSIFYSPVGKLYIEPKYNEGDFTISNKNNIGYDSNFTITHTTSGIIYTIKDINIVNINSYKEANAIYNNLKEIFEPTVIDNVVKTLKINLHNIFTKDNESGKLLSPMHYIVNEDKITNGIIEEFKTEIKYLFITNPEDNTTYKSGQTTPYQNLTNNATDITHSLSANKEMTVTINNVEQHLYNDKLNFTLFMWFPINGLYTGRFIRFDFENLIVK